MPLSLALVGQTVRLVGLVDAGAGLTHRLAEMGLTPGQRFEVINRGPGPFVISVRGGRLVLGKGMVGRMLVRPCLNET
jgi:Fe2+ transport system protein FeoA